MQRVDHPIRPNCIYCGSPAEKGHKRKDGSHGYFKHCRHCTPSGRPWRKHKKSYCEKCGFIAVHKVQLDIDHINADKTDHSISNLQTLCRNCHSLKTMQNEDHLV